MSERGDDPEWRVSLAYMMLITGLRNRVLDPRLERAHHEGRGGLSKPKVSWTLTLYGNTRADSQTTARFLFLAREIANITKISHRHILEQGQDIRIPLRNNAH